MVRQLSCSMVITSTKDMAHQRRAGGRTGATVTFDESMPRKHHTQAKVHQHDQCLYLQKTNCLTYHAPGDADLLIVQKAVDSATTRNTVLIGDDTDLLILLICHTNLESHDLFFQPEPKKSTKNPRVWSIKAVKQNLGSSVCTHILFMYAILWCDSTARLYGIG
jgi:hypothetical protein